MAMLMLLPHADPRLSARRLAALILAVVAALWAAGSAPAWSAEGDDGATLTHQAKDAGIRAAQAVNQLWRPAYAAAVQPLLRTTSSTLIIGTVTIAVPSTPSAVPRFGKVELLVPITTAVATTSFYNPNPAVGLALSCTFTSPTNASWTIQGFYDGSNWRIRFAPNAIGAWSYTVNAQDPSGSASSANGSFTVVTSSSHGWVQVTGNHLTYSADGTTFLGIGHNNGFLDPAEQPAISTLAANGENLLSFWLGNPFQDANRGLIESSLPAFGIGVYNQTACAVIDGIFSEAEAANILLLPSIWSHNQLNDGTPNWGSPQWSGTSYSQIIDPSTSQPLGASQFYQMGTAQAPTQQWTLQQNFLRYLIARWGYSTSLLGWVGVVELDGTTGFAGTGGDPTEAAAWCSAVQSFLSSNDPYRAAGTPTGAYPIGFSQTDQNDSHPFDDGFSMHIMDSYLAQTNPIGIASTIASETIAMHGYTSALNPTTRPCFTSEFGAETNPSDPTALEPLHFHNGIWAGIAAGASLMPLKYCDGSDWPLISNAAINYIPHIQYLSQFLATVPYAGGGAVGNATLSTSSSSTLLAWGQALADRAFAWVQLTTGSTIGGGTLTIGNLTAGTYAVTWYDPWAASFAPLAATTSVATSGTSLILTIPSGSAGDLAVRVQMQPTATPQTVQVVAGTQITITLAGTDGTGALNGAAITSLPTAGTLSQDANGSQGTAFTSPGTVTNAGLAVIYQAGTSTGTDSFAFTVSDGGVASLPAIVQIQILPVNQPPSFTKGTNIALAESSTAIPYSTGTPWATNILNPPIDVSTLTGFTVTTNQPTWFSTPPTIALSGVLSFTVQPYTFGTVSCSATLSDNGSTAGGGANVSAAQTFTITISQVAFTPTTPAQSLTTYPNFPLSITLTATVPDNAPLAFAYTQAPTHGQVTPSSLASFTSSPQVVYTAGPNTATPTSSGSDSFSFQATDMGMSNAGLISLTILYNATPNATPLQLTVVEDQAVGVVLQGNDPDNRPLPLTFAVSSPPAHGTLSGVSPDLTYTPTIGYFGSDSFSYTAFDGAATSTPAVVSITVVSPGSSTPGSTSTSGCGSGNGFATLALLMLTLGTGRRWRRSLRRS